MDDTRREILTAELDVAIRQRDELTVVIEYLSRQVGRSDVTGSSGDEKQPPNGANASASEPVDLVGDGEFFGQSSTEAAAEVLARVGRTRPLRTPVLYDAVVKGGVKVGSPDALYRSLFRNSKFTKVGKSLWGLTEWYPPGAVKSSRVDREVEAASLGITPEDVSTSPIPADTADADAEAPVDLGQSNDG
jgi:hypothetical protein